MHQVCRDGRVYQMAFARGVALGPISERAQSAGAAAEPRGTRITFKPDPTIFKTTTRFNVNKVRMRSSLHMYEYTFFCNSCNAIGWYNSGRRRLDWTSSRT